jgi:DNA-binding NarL/FixJ family response regulator
LSATPYRRPVLRALVYRKDLPKVVTVHENRFVAPGLQEALAGRADVVADTAYGAAALQLADMLTPNVVVAGDLLGDGVIDHFLPDLLRGGTRVLLLVDDLPGDRVLGLVGRGLSGACSTRNALVEVADAVLAVATGGVVLHPALVASIVTQWRSDWRGQTGPEQNLTLREMEILNAMADGLSAKAVARLLGITLKTVENHKTRVFAKLGLHSQAQLVAEWASKR